MKINKVKETPRNIREFPVENELGLSEEQVEDIAEIFQTPLTGAYNWDYTIQDNRIKSCLLYTSPSPRDATLSRMPSSA